MDTGEDLQVDDHLLLFETERYRVFTDVEAAGGIAGGAIGFLGGASYEMYFSGYADKSNDNHGAGQVRTFGTPKTPSFVEHQALDVFGLTAVLAVATIALTASVRLIKYKARVNFKSDLSAEKLEDWYNDDDNGSSA